MALALKNFLFAEYAAVSREGKLIIAGVFDSFELTLRPNVPADADPKVILGPFYLVSIVTCSISDGTAHKAFIRVVNDDGESVADDLDLGPWHFRLNPDGRPMKHQHIMHFKNIALPQPGDYEFELHVDGARLGVTTLYVKDVTGSK